MRCDLLRLNILLREDQEKREQPTTSKLYDVYAYCEGDAHQLGPFECLINRDGILERFKELLPNISLSSLGRGTSQEVIFDKDISLVDALEETTALGKEIFSVMPPIIRESISNSNNIRLFTNDILLPWEIMYNENGFVRLMMTYDDLIDHIVDVDYVIRFERKNDFDTIFNKTFDFSKTTIDRLIDDGYKECSEQLTSTLSRTK
jgi:hypothetical protein